jgi:hypothetical protein
MSNPSALDREWVDKISTRSKPKTPAKERGGSTINCNTYEFHDCVFILGTPGNSGSNSQTLWQILAAVAFWTWVFSHFG